MAPAILDVTNSAAAWSVPAAYAQLRAAARNGAGLDHARSLIRKARGIRYRRYMQLAEMEQAASAEECVQRNPEDHEITSENCEDAHTALNLVRCEELEQAA